MTDATYLRLLLCAGLAFGAACRAGSEHGAGASSGSEAMHGEAACAHEPGVPPEVGEGDQQAAGRPCAPAHSTRGDVVKPPEEL
jgi:hypothetical protein